MVATLFLRPSPRAYFLITETHALIFRQPDAAESKAAKSVVVAEFLPIEEVDVRGLVRASRGKTVEGVLGVTSVPSDRSPVPEIFLVLVSASTPSAPLVPSSPLQPARVVAVEFHSLSSSFWDTPEIAAQTQAAAYDVDLDDPYAQQSFHAGSSSNISQAAAQGVENPCNGMRKYLESGGFFFAEGGGWDISSRVDEINWLQKSTPHPLETFDERFVWNASLLAPLLAFRSGLPAETRRLLDEQSLLIPVIQGFCGSLPITTGTWGQDGKPEIASLGIISRLSWKRAGARFRTRGIDDDGQVANFVETEVILATDSICMSYTQVRGSVPLFWQQPSQGLGTLQGKVEITRPAAATQPAFDKHFLELLGHYHSVHAVNLLGQKDTEAMLSAAYSDHLDALKHTLKEMPPSEKAELQASERGTLDYTPYDFHAAVRVSGNECVRVDLGTRITEMVHSTERFGWTVVDAATGEVIEKQRGVFRTNCLDCLDRTNYVQDVISSLTLSRFLTSIASPLVSSSSLWAAHRELWADNGDRLSKIYAGTGAINTSATRSGKKTFAGLLSDATKSVSRAYINNFQDKGKQNATDLLLGMMAGQRPVILFDPISDSVQAALSSRMSEFSKTRQLSLYVGTWNLNGKSPDEGLDDWLFPPGFEPADVYTIAFQEIVELTAGQILQTDPAKRRRWEKYIMDTFAMRKDLKSEYGLFRSDQLVGTALVVVVKSDLMKHIRAVETATKKTGLQGLSGNKGGVGIRFDLFDTSVCLVTCHLAAGHSNVAERNADYRTISTGLKFLRGKMIEDHEAIVWAADFNYRIAMPGPEVRDLAEAGHVDALLVGDQLLQARDDGEVFVGYEEGPVTFRPTYKYDNGSDDYDTSEKARIPAWTDRILYKGPLKLRAYDRAELRTSDHRPVYGLFALTVREVDQVKKETITREITRHLTKNVKDERLDDKVEKGLKGASKSRHSGLEGVVEEMTASSNIALKPKPPLPPASSKPAATRNDVAPLSNSSARDDLARLAVPSPGLKTAPTPPASRSRGGSSASSKAAPPSRALSIDDVPDNLQAPMLPTRSPRPDSTPQTNGMARPAGSAFAAARAAFENTTPASKSSSAPLSARSTRSNTASSSASSIPPTLPARPTTATSPVTATPAERPKPPKLPGRPGSVDSGGGGGGGGTPAERLSTSPVITPASTGDYVLVPPVSGSRAPPVLPSRPAVGQLVERFTDDASSIAPAASPASPPVSSTGSSQAGIKKPPPVVPKKPVTLRSTSVSAESSRDNQQNAHRFM